MRQPLKAGWNPADGGPQNLDAVLGVHDRVPERANFSVKPSLRKLLRLGQFPESGEQSLEQEVSFDDLLSRLVQGSQDGAV